MYRLTFTAGIGEDHAGEPLAVPEVNRALAHIRSHLANVFGGYTETQATGGWINPNGRLVVEPSIRWIVLTDADHAPDAVEDIARVIGHELRQASVVWEREAIAAGFTDTAPEAMPAAA